MFTLDYKETTVNPLSDKVVSGACVYLKIFVCVCVLKCAVVMKKWRRGVNVCVSLRCLCPCGLYRI